DCGVNTAPGMPDGWTMRAELETEGKSKFHYGSKSEVYIVRNPIWKEAGMAPWGGCLCIGCLEKRLGRELSPRDFANKYPGTPRLLSRQGRKVWHPPE